MARTHLILDRYELLGTAGAGGFGTVQIAWDPRIQRKVAIKTIELSEYDAYRAGLPGADGKSAAHAPVEAEAPAASAGENALASEGASTDAPVETEAPADSAGESAHVSEGAGAEDAGIDKGAADFEDIFESEGESQSQGQGQIQIESESARKLADSLPAIEGKSARTLADSLPVIERKDARWLADSVPVIERGGARRLADSLPLIESESSHSLADSVPAIEGISARTLADSLPLVGGELDDDGASVAAGAVSAANVEDVDYAAYADDDGIEYFNETSNAAQAANAFSGYDAAGNAFSGDAAGLSDADAAYAEAEADAEAGIADSPVDAAAPDATSVLGANAFTTDGTDSNMADSADIAPGESISLLHSDPVTALAHVPGLDEARTAAMLTDPRIVAVYDFEVRDRTAYLIMEYVEGITLTTLLHEFEDHLTLDVVTCVFDAVAGALSAAHGTGVLHLDIKPDNILINAKGQAKVTDFGLATLADASGSGTTGGGTIGYMPLEQMRREHLDARADEWSLAAVLYEMLTGDNPFRARSLAEAESAILDAELILPSLCWDVIDEQIDDVIFYALDPNREERYESVADFAEEADKFLGDADLGQQELADLVSDALSEDDPEDQAAGEAVGDEADRSQPTARKLRPRDTTVIGALGSVIGDAVHKQAQRQAQAAQEQVDYDAGYHAGYDAGLSAGYDAYEAYDDEEERPSRGLFSRLKRGRTSGEGAYRTPIAERLSPRALDALARVFSGLAAGLLAFFACSGIEALPSMLGDASLYAEIGVALVMAVVAIVRPDVGALASFCLFGAALVMCGHPVVGGALALFTALWWYITGREGVANANVSLLAPLAGCIGCASAVPFAAGAALRPVQAGVTVAFSVVVAAVFASLGSGTLVGWDVFSHAQFNHVDITRNLTNLMLLPATWATAAGWIVGALALSLCDSRGGKMGTIVGLALCAASVLAGTLIFSVPTPQLFLSVIIAAVALFVVR